MRLSIHFVAKYAASMYYYSLVVRTRIKLHQDAIKTQRWKMPVQFSQKRKVQEQESFQRYQQRPCFVFLKLESRH